MKFSILIILSLFYFSNVNAQQHDNIWLVTASNYTSPSTKLDFSSGNPSIDTAYRNLPITRTNLTMSDSLGNLLFYCNGIKIYNAQYQLIDNGDSLNPGPIANSNTSYPYIENITCIPHPSESNKYYIFHLSVTTMSSMSGFFEKLYYTLVDMNANGGLGIVEKKNQILLENDSICSGQLEVVKHGNGRDWWLIQPMGYSNGYHIFLISENGITYHHKQYIGNPHLNETEWLGQAIFSHQGNKYFRYDYLNDLDIFDFDRCSGYLSNYLHIPLQDTIDSIPNSGYYTGLAISPNDRYLYISPTYHICQFDLWASNIATSIDTVASFDNYMHNNLWPTYLASLQSAPNGKIYGTVYNTPYFHVIDSPDIGGIGCNVIQRGLEGLPNNTYIPSFPHYRTPALSGSACDTITNTKTVETPEKEIQIYPNPTSGLVYIEAVQEIEQLSIHDALGREVYWYHQPRQQGITLDTQQWDNGIYYISIWLDGKIVQEKIHVLR